MHGCFKMPVRTAKVARKQLVPTQFEKTLQLMHESIAFFMSSFVQLTVVLLLPLGMDLWKATLTQQRVQWCSTDVTRVWFQRGG